jgi:ABC-type phosphate transport system auxiliary subunit
MAEFLTYFITYLLGLTTGFVAFLIYGVYQVRELKQKRDNLVGEVKKKALEMEAQSTSIKERLTQASKLAQTQAQLRSQVELPSKNSTHSKHKNGLISEIQDLEQQKIDILKTILAEGFNPVITVVHEGGAKQEVPLSDYVAAAQETVNASSGDKRNEVKPLVTNNPDLPKQVGKFFVHKGGKPDGTIH